MIFKIRVEVSKKYFGTFEVVADDPRDAQMKAIKLIGIAVEKPVKETPKPIGLGFSK